MEKFLVVYEHFIDDYFNAEDNDTYIFKVFEYEHSKDNLSENFKYYLKRIEEIKKIILSDFRKILEYRIKENINSEELVEDVENLLSTFNNGIDFNNLYGLNFMILTNNYLCFNNYENYIDELLWGHLGTEAKTYETIIIVDRKFLNFYFFTNCINFFDGKEKTIFRHHHIKNNKVESHEFELNSKIILESYTEETIESIVKRFTM